MPPLRRIISSIPPAIIVMIISSPIEPIPSPAVESQSSGVILPQAIPINPADAIPDTSTISTFTPAIAAARTSR